MCLGTVDFLTGKLEMNNHRHVQSPFYGQTSEALKVGMEAISSGDLEKGLEVYQSILEIEPDNKLVRERIRKLGARPAIKPPKLLKIRLAPRARVKNLMKMADSGRCLAVLYDLSELLPQYPRDSILYFLKANMQRELGRTKESVANYERSIELNSRYSPAHLNLGCSYSDIGNSKAAIKSIERAIELDRKNFLAFYHLALLKEEEGDTDGSIENYLRALRICPEHAESNNQLGRAFFERGQSARAIKLFERAVKASPDFEDAYVNLGIAHKDLGQIDSAKKNLQKALVLSPDHVEALREHNELTANS